MLAGLKHSPVPFPLVALMFITGCVALAVALVLGTPGGKLVPGSG